MNKPDNSTATQTQQADNKTPGRTTGFVIMVVMIVFVAVYMQQQSRTGNAGLADQANALPGFRADAWYLPDGPMLGFVEIPGGEFTMGSNPALDRMAYENERWSGLQRQGQVSLPGFYIARFETTQAQFQAFARDTGLAQQALDSTVPGDYPVSNITWPEALAYARWLDAQLRDSPQTPAVLRQFLESGAQVSLPSEAQWEKAARGSDGRIFPWGSQPRRNLAVIGTDAPQPVGSIDCVDCAHGLADMAGNVWELTRSPLQDYPYDPADDLKVSNEDPIYVMRGGSYTDAINNARAAVRGGVDPGARRDSIGFRVVISPQR